MGGHRKISLYNQYARVKQIFSNWDCRILFNNKLVIIGNVQPTALSENYTIRIEYGLKHDRPTIEVVSPNLKIHPNWKELPHIFPGDKLCLYHKEFDPHIHYIADTNIVWVTWWLYFYEIWLVTGEWKGGGIEHSGIHNNS